LTFSLILAFNSFLDKSGNFPLALSRGFINNNNDHAKDAIQLTV